MKDTGRPVDQVADYETARYEGVGDQPPMAAPPEGLGAHDCQVIAGCSTRLEVDQGGPEIVRVHVGGVSREGG